MNALWPEEGRSEKGPRNGWRTIRNSFRLYAHQDPIQMPLETARNDRRVRVGQSAKRSEVISVFRSDLHAFRVGARLASQSESETRRALRVGGPRRTSHVILKASVVNIRKCHFINAKIFFCSKAGHGRTRRQATNGLLLSWSSALFQHIPPKTHRGSPSQSCTGYVFVVPSKGF